MPQIASPVVFFASGQEMRDWLESNHATSRELWVGLRRRGLGGTDYGELVEAALSYGRIDGVRKKYDESSSATRFSPRRKGSLWSAIPKPGHSFSGRRRGTEKQRPGGS